MKETWKDIKGYEGLYKISNLGRIKNKRNKFKYPPTMDNGYKKVVLYKNGVLKNHLVHRLVWMTFNGEIPNDMQVNHIDENKENNCLWNLELMTPKENINYGTGVKRRTITQSKPIIAVSNNEIVHFSRQYKKQQETGFWLIKFVIVSITKMVLRLTKI